MPSVAGGDPQSEGYVADGARSVSRICLLVENHSRAVMGSAQYQAGLIAEALARETDIEVFYLARRCPERSADLEYEIVKIGNDKGIRRRAVIFDALSLWRALKRIDPDVIYQRMRQSYTGIAGL